MDKQKTSVRKVSSRGVTAVKSQQLQQTKLKASAKLQRKDRKEKRKENKNAKPKQVGTNASAGVGDEESTVSGACSPEANTPPMYQMPLDQQAIFQSPLAHQGLHPAYLMGLQCLPNSGANKAKSSDYTSMPQDVLRRLQLIQQENQQRPAIFSGDFLAVNPHASPPEVGAMNRWPFVPEKTVPGFIFEGAEFYDPDPKPKEVNTFRGRRSREDKPAFWSFQQFRNTFAACWSP